jgi:hypothetical protein
MTRVCTCLGWARGACCPASPRSSPYGAAAVQGGCVRPALVQAAGASLPCEQVDVAWRHAPPSLAGCVAPGSAVASQLPPLRLTISLTLMIVTRPPRSDVDLDGRDDLVVFTEKGSFYMISNGDNFNDPVSTASWGDAMTASVAVPDVRTLGMTDETAAIVVASSSVIRDAPLEQRCGVPYRLVAYYSNRRRDSSTACVQVRLGRARGSNASRGTSRRCERVPVSPAAAGTPRANVLYLCVFLGRRRAASTSRTRWPALARPRTSSLRTWRPTPRAST